MDARGSGLKVEDEIVRGIDVKAHHIAEVALAVLLGPAGIGVLLPALVRVQVLGFLAPLDGRVSSQLLRWIATATIGA